MSVINAITFLFVFSRIKPLSRLCIQATGCALLKSPSKMSQVSSVAVTLDYAP